jgi:hypothetical protein
MKANITMTGDTETSGTRFFTWAILVVVAGLLVAVMSDVTSQGNLTAASHVSATQSETAPSAS